MSEGEGESLQGIPAKEQKRPSKIAIFVVVLVVALVISAVVWVAVLSLNNSGQQPTGSDTHLPILINGNEEFTKANGVVGGNGTVSAPYIIENWRINATDGAGIQILNATALFIVRSCVIHDGYPNDAIYLDNCTNGLLVNNTCSGTYGILISGSTNITAQDNHCTPNNWNGIKLYSSTYCTVSNNTCAANGDGIGLEYSDNNRVIDNDCTNGSNGIAIVASSENNTVVGNNCSFNDGSGAVIAQSSNNSLVNNKFSGNSMIGVWIEMSSQYNALTGNLCTLNGEFGIQVDGSYRNTLSDNNCSSNGWWGMSAFYSSRNTFEDNNCSWNNYYGMYLKHSDNCTLNGNGCVSNGFDGIYLESSSNNSVTNNTCAFNDGSSGILLGSGSNNNTLVRNDCSSNNGTGIILESSSGNSLLNDTCGLNNLDGIRLHLSCYGNELTGNLLLDNALRGVNISLSSDNRVWNNTFVGNDGSGSTYDAAHVQACDNGTGNLWNTPGHPRGYGNYWSDWTTPDANHDGIVDQPYAISGSSGAEDSHPLATSP